MSRLMLKYNFKNKVEISRIKSKYKNWLYDIDLKHISIMQLHNFRNVPLMLHSKDVVTAAAGIAVSRSPNWI